MTLPMISSEATPGYPAPETACMVETNSRSTPKARCSGARASARTAGGAVGVGENGALPASLLLLTVDQRQVIRIGLRNEKGHVGIHPMGARVRHQVRPCPRELLLD